MSRKTKAASYLHHTPSNRGYSRVTDPATGKRSTVYFSGKHNSVESRAEYAEFLREQAGQATPDGRYSCEQLAMIYLENERDVTDFDNAAARGRYGAARKAAELLATLGDLPANEITCGKLVGLQEVLVKQGKLALRTLNRRINHVRRIIRFGTQRDMVSGGIFHDLEAVEALTTRTAPSVTAPQEVDAADAGDVAAMREALSETVRAMVDVQALTGCRAGELVQLAWHGIVRDDPRYLVDGVQVWYFDPPQHKNRWRKKARRIFIGPEAQAVLLKYEAARPVKDTEFIFTPRESAAWHLWQKSQRYAAKPTQYHEYNGPRRLTTWSEALGSVGDDIRWQFASHAYGRSIGYACKKVRVLKIKTHQLRHHVSVTIDRKADGGREAAAAVLGHAIDTAAIYAGHNYAKAAETMAAHG
jgi:integrase